MAWADRLREEGFRAGFQEGYREGFQAGLQEARQEALAPVVRAMELLFALRFGPLTDSVITRIRAADLPTLEVWSEEVLHATSVEDLLDLGPPAV